MIRLVQFTIKELEDGTSKTYLKRQQRMDALNEPRILRAFASTLIFQIPSSQFMQNGTYWHVYVLFQDLKTIVTRKDVSLEEAVRMAIDQGDVHAACTCLHPETEIITDRGVIPIKDVQPEDKVLTHKGRFKRVLGVICDDLPKQFYQVKVRGQLKPLICSGEHPILTYTRRSSEPVWTKVSELSDRHGKPDQNCALLPVIKGGDPFDTDLARLLGYYLAEGCVDSYKSIDGEKLGSRVRLTFNCDEKDTLVRDVQQICKKLDYLCSVEEVHYPSQSWITVSIKNKEFAQKCVHCCGRFSTKKRLSSEVFSWCDSARLALLTGHVLGDGFHERSKGFSFLTTSRQLVQQLQALLASLGMNAFVSMHNKYSTINPNRKAVHPVYQVKCSENSSFLLYQSCLPYLRAKDQHWTRTEGTSKNYVKSGYFYRYIEDIKPITYKGEYYDLVVEDDASFIADSVTIHNCPAYTYWAHKYYGTQLDYTYGPYKTNIAPTRNNTQMRSLICKHESKVFEWIHNNVDKIVEAFRGYYGYIEERKDPDDVRAYEGDASDVQPKQEESKPEAPAKKPIIQPQPERQVPKDPAMQTTPVTVKQGDDVYVSLSPEADESRARGAEEKPESEEQITEETVEEETPDESVIEEEEDVNTESDEL